MATRFYFPSSGVAPSSPTVDTLWERQIAAFTRYPAPTTKTDTPLTDVSALFGATTSSQTLWAQFISEPLDVDQAISGTGTVIIRTLEGGSTEDAHLAFVVRVMVGDTSTERGTLWSSIASTSEFPTGTPATRRHSGVALSAVNALAGDRLCAELGVVGVTPANAANITLRIGDPSGTADFANTVGLTTDLCPWWELSQTLTFGTPAAGYNVVLGKEHRRRRSTLIRM